MKELITWCLNRDGRQPTSTELAANLKQLSPTKDGIADLMMETMEGHMENLEVAVDERTKQLQSVSNVHGIPWVD